MKLIVEGYPYTQLDVERVLQGIDAPQNKDGFVRVNYVGYFYNKRLNDCVFFLPKVVIDENHQLLGRYTPEELIDVEHCKRMRREDRDFIYGLSVWIYRAIRQFQRLNEDSEIVYVNTYSRLDGSSNRVNNTLLDVILSLIRFNNENHDFFMFIMKNIHSGYNKINWTKTISRNQAMLQRGRPVYVELVNKKKQINFDEELLIIYYSVLNHIQERYGFRTDIDGNYELITGNVFKRWLNGYGKLRLRQIKYKYFSDKALALWKHCYAFFDLAQLINSSRQQSDYMLVKNFNIVFEAIIDNLLSDEELNQSYLKNQPDGKLVDHIYAYDGLINDDERIYYIGDSKYYKLGEAIGPNSVYKQYTYARNVIQYNLKLFLRDEKDEFGRGKGAGTEYLIYRDPDTEGYNITPNFFISARLNQEYNYNDPELRFVGDEKPIKHFENRLFDRDTLLLQRYDVNFLFVVALYAGDNDYAKGEFKKFAQRKFREEIIKYLENHYQFFSLQKRPDNTEPLQAVINSHFRDIIGRTFRPYSNNDILYVSCETKERYRDENLALLSKLSDDFIIRDYKLGTDPRDSINHFTHIFGLASKQESGETKPRKFTFEDFADETILIGGYRSEKNQLQWILEHKDYNVRASVTRRGNIGRIREKAVSARVLVLYNINAPKEKPIVFLLSGHRYVKASTMLKMGYDTPEGNYLLYNLVTELQFESFEVLKVINYARIEEMERRRKRHLDLSEGWEDKWYGTPLFYKGSELIHILAGHVVTESVANEPEPQFLIKEDELEPPANKDRADVTSPVTESESAIAAEPSVTSEPASTEVPATTEAPQVEGIWRAFKSVQFRKRYEKRLIDSGERKSQAVFKMQHFYNKVKDADQGGIFHRRLNECMTFDEMHTILTDLFDAWRNNLKYPWVRDLFFNYLVYLRELYLANGNLDDSKEKNLTKSSKIQLTYRNGTVEQLNPLAALLKVVLMVGPDKVSQMNLRIHDDKLLMKYKPFNDKYYKQIKENWWILTKGTPKAKYQTLYSILLRYSSLGIKIKLI